MSPGVAIRQAWRFVTGERPRMARSVAGVSFAGLLIVLQLGFRAGIVESAAEPLRHLDADIIVFNAAKDYFYLDETTPIARLYQVKSARGVGSAVAMHMTTLPYKNPIDGSMRPIRVLGVDPASPGFTLEEITARAHRLAQPGAALMDDRSRRYFGPIQTGPAEVARRRIEIVGTYSIGSDFNSEGTIIVGEETFFELSGRSRGSDLQYILVKLAPGADLPATLGVLKASLPSSSAAFSKAELWEREVTFWGRHSPAGAIFGLGVFVGFLVGIVIFYQILFTQISDHLSQYATMKAIGYSDRDLVALVLLQSLVLSLLGFLVAVGIGALCYVVIEQVTGLIVRLQLENVLLLLILTLGMSVFGALFAIRKLLAADPAEVFA